MQCAFTWVWWGVICSKWHFSITISSQRNMEKLLCKEEIWVNVCLRGIWVRFFCCFWKNLVSGYNWTVKTNTLSFQHFITLSSVMENSFNSASFNHVNGLVQKIDSLTKDIEKALALCFDITGEKVAWHSITLTQKCDSEFVDTVVVALHNMKNHLSDLKRGLTSFSSIKEMNTIVRWLMDASDNLQQLLLSNNFFNTTFQLLVSEVQTMIDRVLEEIPVSAMAA